MNMNMMNEQNPKIEVAHTRDEMLHILENMRTEGFHKEDIHIIAKDSQQLEDVKWDDDVHTHEAGNWVDQFKSWFTGDSAVTEGLKRFNLSEGQIAYYAHLVEQGSIVLFAERDDDYDTLQSQHPETAAEQEERLRQERLNEAEQLRRFL
ncbi:MULTISPECIES: general stress protein [Lysinibacillus]|nr:general stress protein [Lysinibacillus fusiformis]MCG7434671.1 general stress protein [Lysinibacillus fusiformis]SCX45599.1 Heat induced stress protein YflT [Lysinibacillus fusiformis]SDB16891.1 Heat induced stress protein YflT [Lysinibacillus fusiformis]SFI00347.1 Heat induced stress protein YflT [Lysinibacillus fusiformis]SFS46773.1 Heat induced stress protein YflT [Lysinibacillus fusiformis]